MFIEVIAWKYLKLVYDLKKNKTGKNLLNVLNSTQTLHF